MRTHILAALALMVPACAGEISSTGGGGDDGAAVCGNGQIETGEQCDDGNSAAGDGCSATCQTEQVVTPRVTLTVDKPTITSDLGVDNTVVVTATSEMGYAGTITLAAAAMDSTNVAITDWMSTLDQTSLTLTAGGTAMANLKLSALGDAAMLGGTVTLTATGPATPATTTVGVTFNGVLHVTFADNSGTCQYPTTTVWKLKAGRQIAVYNSSATKKFVVHTQALIPSFPHEGDTGTGPGEAYIKTIDPNAAGQADQFYCHNDGTASVANGYLDGGNINGGPVLQIVN
jgi:cysteine-rich repeat protein